MPIRRIGLRDSIAHLTVLDESGRFDESLDPNIPREDLIRLYECIVLVRAHDERKLRLQRQGRIGTFAPATGQEAAQLGSIYAIRKEDWFVPSFRETAAAVWRGMALEDDLLFCAGREEGINIADDANDLPISIPVASQLPHAVGLAWAMKRLGSDRVVLAYLGDGATSEGDFHEALNLAGLHKLPIVFLCQNNQWAISVPRTEQTASKTLAQKALAYDLEGIAVDGNDLFAVYRVAKEAVDRARSGKGGTLIEAVTYRLGVHTTADDPTKYRSKEEEETWLKRDPLPRLRAYLRSSGVLDEDRIKAIDEDAAEKVNQAVKAFEGKPPPDPLEMFDHAYEEPPPYLERQRKELEAEIPKKEEAAPRRRERPRSAPTRRTRGREAKPQPRKSQPPADETRGEAR